ncbi:MAG: N-acetyltransferase [Alphaproteobacteria bacterium]|nr:N-acetyltransferase [Alphaproteobacteria bacterium]
MLPLPNRLLTLRELNIADAAWMALLHKECFTPLQCWTAESFHSLLLQPSNAGIVLITKDEPAGFILASHVADEGEILTLAVHPTQHRKGYGTLLVNSLIETRQKHGPEHHIQKLFLDVMENNHGAIALYRSLGFEVIAKREGYYQMPAGKKNMAALVMQKKLNEPQHIHIPN